MFRPRSGAAALRGERPLAERAGRDQRRRHLLCLPLLLLLTLAPDRGGAEIVRVFVSVAPLDTFVQRVGGDRVTVGVMVQPGQSPATYEPSPRQIAALAEADLFLRTGVPFEDAWMGRIRAANANMRVLDAREGLDLRPLARHAHEPADGSGRPDRPEGAGEQDPHVWTSPPLVKRMAAGIRDALIDLSPADAAAFRRGYAAFAADLDALDGYIRDQLRGLARRKFLAFHPAWGYFADTYGLTQVAVEREGKQPGARTLATLIEEARGEGIAVVFVQPQFGDRSATQVARAIGARVVTVDPLAADYIRNMRRVAEQFAAALR
jgi:zinc transport system substrate-binding protein